VRGLCLEQRRIAVAGGDVWAVAAGLDDDRLTGLRVLAEFAFSAPAAEQLLDLLQGQLVRRDAVRDRGAIVLSRLFARERPLEVRAVLADAYHDRPAGVV